MSIRRAFILAISFAYLSTAVIPTEAVAQDTGALIGGLAGGVIGGMIAGSMARPSGGYYRRSYASRGSRGYRRTHVSRARASAPAKAESRNAATINASGDPFAKGQTPQTTSVGSR